MKQAFCSLVGSSPLVILSEAKDLPSLSEEGRFLGLPALGMTWGSRVGERNTCHA
jgi:hypothetical protein